MRLNTTSNIFRQSLSLSIVLQFARLGRSFNGHSSGSMCRWVGRRTNGVHLLLLLMHRRTRIGSWQLGESEMDPRHRGQHQDSLKRPNVCTAPATRAPTTLLTHHQLVGPRHDRAIKTVLPSGCPSVKAARGLARVSCTMIMISSVLNARRTSTTRGTGRPSKVLAVFFYHVFFFVLFLFSVSFLGFEKRRNS
jgi:hypothetical protein